MAVVAEGVETPSQHAQLIELGCDRAQGFWFAPAGPSTAIEDRVLGTPPSPSLMGAWPDYSSRRSGWMATIQSYSGWNESQPARG